MPAVSYASAADGVHIAYCRLGAGAPLLVAAGPMLSCQSAVLGNPRAYAFLRALAARYEVVLIDERGTGSSAGDLDGRNPVADAADLQSVVDAAGLEHVNLLGAFASATNALEWVADHGENAARVVLWAAVPDGAAMLQTKRAQAIAALMQVDEELGFRVLVHALGGWRTGLVPSWLCDMFREVYGICGLQRWLSQVSITAERLALITADTLIVQPSQASLIEVEGARQLTASMPNARMMQVDTESIVPYADDIEQATQAILDALSQTWQRVSAPGEWAEGVPLNNTSESPLTIRERDVLRLIARGDSSKEIAAQLDISVNTVDRHISNIYRKLGVRGRAKAAAYAVKQGIG